MGLRDWTRVIRYLHTFILINIYIDNYQYIKYSLNICQQEPIIMGIGGANIMTNIKKSNGCCLVFDAIQLSSQSAKTLAAEFKAMGHPVRLQILRILSQYGGQACVCDIESQFDLAQPTISHHLKVLRTAGLIDCTREGQWYHYRVRPDCMELLQDLLFTLSPVEEVK